MNMKKMVAGVVACCMVGGAVPFGAVNFADVAIIADATDEAFENFTYSVKNDTVTITGFDNSVADVVIPESINDMPVVEIGKNAFADAYNLESVVIPEGVTTIGESAFSKCTALEKVTFPSTLTTMNHYVFQNCVSLGNFELPDGLSSVGWNVFSGCVYITELVIPGSLLAVNHGFAAGCTGLRKVTVNQGVTYIGRSAFSDCTSLTTVELPKSITGFDGTWMEGNFLNSPVTDVYYAGSDVQWNAIEKSERQFDTTKTTIHYGEKAPIYKTGDINHDGLVDATDASEILAYYAYLSTGGTLTYEAYKAEQAE